MNSLVVIGILAGAAILLGVILGISDAKAIKKEYLKDIRDAENSKE